MRQVEEIKEQLQKAYVVQNTAKMNADQGGGQSEGVPGIWVEDIQKEAQDLDRQITDIVDNQESINVELDTSQELEGPADGQDRRRAGSFWIRSTSLRLRSRKLRKKCILSAPAWSRSMISCWRI